MPSIELFEFRDMFSNAKSAAFIGNSSSILNWENGNMIDSYDLVIRFNRAYTKGVEQKIGSKTNILISNNRNCLDLAPPPLETLKPECVVTFVKPKKNLDIKPLKEWVGNIPHLITLGPDIININVKTRTRSLTMGTYALYTFLRLFEFEKIFVSGFTMFGVTTGGGEKYYEKNQSFKVGQFHDLDNEAIIFSNILQQYKGELKMTEEVERLVNQCLNTKSLIKKPKLNLFIKVFHFLSIQFIRAGFMFRRLVEKSTWLYHDN